ncbi:hypothetical protein GCM10023328_39700 [Modestobacter marinus]|uniref:GT2 family glycosyltransferase n=1 Tax=Modestobacter marinus TaxID=477641 RepID=A0A846LFE2_9ACTN|nr:glycosyltransferase [Modestobacter marinus]NIH65931.1 GT2 family glycosyltransferase [Modestobacter marinus]GGL68184.1 hypothetical protein GCM10011589_25700 [Modestobacter marinus]
MSSTLRSGTRPVPGPAERAGEATGVLGLVVVNYGSSRLIEANLAGADPTGPSVRVVVVDNFSSTAERQAVETLTAARGWDLVALPDNRGFGAAVNAGIDAARQAGCVTFLLLNPDASIAPAVVEELRRHSLREPLALLSPRIVTPEGAVFFDGAQLYTDTGRLRGRRPAGPRSRPGGPVEEWLTGACLVVHDDLLRRAGGLAEDFFLYWEDVEFSHRCLAAGGTLTVRSDLVAVHDAGGTQGPRRGRAKSALYYRYNCRNRLLFAARNLGRRQLLRWVWATPAVSREILLRGGRRQLLHQPGLLLAAVHGSVEGLAVAARALLTRRAGRTGTGTPTAVLVVHPGAELYGSDRMLLESVTGLVEAGAPVVVALPGDGPLAAELRGRGARVETCPTPVLRKSALTPRGALRLAGDLLTGIRPAWRLLRRTGSGPVYVNTQTLPLWPLLARVAGRPVVLHVHEAEDRAPAPVRLALALPALAARTVLVNSEYSRSVLAAVLPRTGARAVLVDNGVGGPPSTEPARSRLSGPVQLAFVGRLSPRKGPQVAVAVLAELVSRGVDARLQLLGAVFPGYEWFEQQLRDQVAGARLTDRVELTGFVPDVWDALARADVVLVPSVLAEPFGNTAVEAVLAARPVVVSACGGLQEAVAGRASAQAVPPEDVVAWADAVERVVARWPDVTADALTDAEEARLRHAPDRYRARVAQLVTGAGEDQP